MIIFDSNIWIAFLHEEDTQHKKSLKLFSDYKDTILLPDYIIIEICSVLSKKLSKKQADFFIDRILETNSVDFLFSDEDSFLALLEFFQSSTFSGLSFVDVALLYLSQSYKVVTLDKKLENYIKKLG